MKAGIILPAVLLLYFSLVGSAFADTFTFSGAPANVNEADTFTINVNLAIGGSSGSNYYIRGAFAPSSSPNSYFGYTKNK